MYYSSFSSVTACTYDWLTDGRSLIKAKLNSLINSVCFQVQSTTKKGKHGNYSVKSTTHGTCKYTVESESGVHGT